MYVLPRTRYCYCHSGLPSGLISSGIVSVAGGLAEFKPGSMFWPWLVWPLIMAGSVLRLAQDALTMVSYKLIWCPAKFCCILVHAGLW